MCDEIPNRKPIVGEYVVRVRTKDGGEFDNDRQAAAHVVDEVCEFLDNKISVNNEMWSTSLTRSQVVKVVSALAGDIDSVKELKAMLDSYLH